MRTMAAWMLTCSNDRVVTKRVNAPGLRLVRLLCRVMDLTAFCHRTVAGGGQHGLMPNTAFSLNRPVTQIDERRPSPPPSSLPMPPSLRIAVVTETYPPEVNGVAMTIARFVDGLRQRQHDVQLVRPRQHANEVPQSSNRFNEVLVRGLPIPRYSHLKMGLPATRAL